MNNKGADWFESHFVGNPEDRFSCDEAHIIRELFRSFAKDAGQLAFSLQMEGPVAQSVMSLIAELGVPYFRRD